MSGNLLSHSNSFGFEMEKDAAGCRALNRNFIVGGVTIFLSSHVLSEVQRLCDRVAILREGKLISVQSMKELRENGYKKISLTAKSAIPEDFFSVPGTANLEWDKSKTSVSFMFSGPVMMIMNQLHRLELEDILIEEPSLEEVFLHYYE